MKQVIVGLVAASLAFGPVAANAACFTDVEWRAAHVRVYQTDLQVAALECENVAGHNYTDQYNSFIAKMRDRLIEETDRLKAHFKRVFGAAGPKELDIFVTKVANDSSGRSMSDMSFCANSASFFESATAIDKPQLEQAALDHVTDKTTIGDLCQSEPAAAPHKKPVKAVATATATQK